jgi:hypothetical protein
MSSGITRWLVGWNKKLHIYLGLYFIVFLWLFAVSGLRLNHAWSFTEFWSQRRQSTTEHTIARPHADTDLGRARDLMKQLGIGGEVEWTTARPTPDRFDFRVVRPGRILDVKADFEKQTAAVQEIRVNGWGVIRNAAYLQRRPPWLLAGRARLVAGALVEPFHGCVGCGADPAGPEQSRDGA